ncbi:MarR family winged helix-turn-helix transcriptional regulator [Alteromonas halophila]|uniref:MarR family transcriptional regulator n=1 Tax=Alteromonas halophila TaxID=516698 RepID=A0A918JG51_9ALTE|nr:MarR family transcriptional regulator [Alteromonas halophila]GGW78333.1 MarR family transcriptional regulator [Alteromonas halophila]
MSSDRLLLDNQLCFSLYATSLAMTQLYKPHLKQLGLTYTQYTIMLILWEQDALSLKAICEQLGQKPGALAPVIKRMESQGLLVRARGVDDDRALTIRLTDNGRALREQGLKVNQCVFEACGLPGDKLRDLKHSLDHLRARITGSESDNTPPDR